jgi:putative lipoic acid-binding regulatory protein
MSTVKPEDYPAEFPIKVMGRQDTELRSATREIIERHVGPLTDDRIRVRTSGDGNFLALTYTIVATGRDQLDAIYRDLTACKLVLMAL